MSKKNGKVDASKQLPRGFVSVYDGVTKRQREVSCDLYTAAKAFTDVYKGQNATNGAMFKVLDDLNSKYVDEADVAYAEQTGENFGYSVDIDWTIDSLAGDGPFMRISVPGKYGTVIETLTMDNACSVVDRTDKDLFRYSLYDNTEDELQEDILEYISRFDGMDGIRKDVKAFDEKRDSEFDSVFGSMYYPSVMEEIKQDVLQEPEAYKSKGRELPDNISYDSHEADAYDCP